MTLLATSIWRTSQSSFFAAGSSALRMALVATLHWGTFKKGSYWLLATKRARCAGAPLTGLFHRWVVGIVAVRMLMCMFATKRARCAGASPTGLFHRRVVGIVGVIMLICVCVYMCMSMCVCECVCMCLFYFVCCFKRSRCAGVPSVYLIGYADR